MFYSENPVADAEAYYSQKEKELEQLPRCSECGERIQSDYAYEIDGNYICEDCLTDNHRVWVSDL